MPRRATYPSARQCGWSSAVLIAGLTTATAISLATEQFYIPTRLFVIALAVAIIFGAGAWTTGPVLEALKLGRHLQREVEALKRDQRLHDEDA